MYIVSDKEGQSLTEYALLLLFIAIVVVAAVLIFGETVANLFQLVVDMWPSP